jgi:hypothetical protein
VSLNALEIWWPVIRLPAQFRLYFEWLYFAVF